MKKNEIVETITNLNKNVDLLFNDLHSQLSKVDLKLNDLYHLLEYKKHYKLNAPILTKIAVKIAELRNERREIKEYITIINSVKPATNKMNKSVKDKIKSQSTIITKPKTNIYESIGISTEKYVIIK